MSINWDDAERLRNAGFLNEEIEAFANATVNQYDMSSQVPIDLNSELWQNVMRSRADLWRTHRDQGWTDIEILEMLIAAYKRNQIQPFDFVKDAYSRLRKKMDYRSGSAARKAKQRLQKSGTSKNWNRIKR